MGIERDGITRKVTAADGEVSAKAGQIHRFFIHPESTEDMTVYLSASDSGKDYQLDRIFFENWYGYWHDALLHDGGLNLFQFLSVRHPVPAQPHLNVLPSGDSADPRRWRRLLRPALVGAIPPYRRLLGLRHLGPLGWRPPWLQAFFQRVYDRLGFRSGEDEGIALSAPSS